MVCDAARASGYLPALLVSVGLPYETADDIDRKIAFIREVGAARVRFVPFEARYGYPVWDVCEEAGMFNGRGETWNREVYHPLNQPSIDIEDWHRAWQRCLDLQAELQLTHPSEFEPRAREETT